MASDIRVSDLGNPDDVLTFLAAVILVYTIVAALCSSPQTAEINANKRSATLMKWVWIGLAQSAIFVCIAVTVDKKRWPTLIGGGMAGALLAASYIYAKNCGLNSGLPGTES